MSNAAAYQEWLKRFILSDGRLNYRILYEALAALEERVTLLHEALIVHGVHIEVHPQPHPAPEADPTSDRITHMAIDAAECIESCGLKGDELSGYIAGVLKEYAPEAEKGTDWLAVALRHINASNKLLTARVRAEERERFHAAIAPLREWTYRYGEDLVPHGPDTYGDGVRESKQRVRTLLFAAIRSLSPAGSETRGDDDKGPSGGGR